MIRNLLFDLGNVLVGLDFEKGYRAASQVSPYSPAEIRGRFRRMRLAEAYEKGEMTSREFYERCREALSLDADYELFTQIWGDMFVPDPLVDRTWLEALGRRYRLVLASNTNEIHFSWLAGRYPMLELFDSYVLSYEIGWMKPDLGFYAAALQKAGAGPRECFFVDDREENVKGARAAGIDAEIFAGEAGLREALANRGIEW